MHITFIFTTTISVHYYCNQSGVLAYSSDSASPHSLHMLKKFPAHSSFPTERHCTTGSQNRSKNSECSGLPGVSLPSTAACSLPSTPMRSKHVSSVMQDLLLFAWSCCFLPVGSMLACTALPIMPPRLLEAHTAASVMAGGSPALPATAMPQLLHARRHNKSI